MTIDEALREYEARATLRHTADFGKAAPSVPEDERERDVHTLRALVRRYGAYVEFAARSMASEPEFAKIVMSARNTDIEIARRLTAGEDLTPDQVHAHVSLTPSEQTPERIDHWLGHVLARAETATGDELRWLVFTAMRLLASYVKRDRGQPLDPRWQAVTRLAPPNDRAIARELKRQGVVMLPAELVGT